jgi:hypothetical protein
MTDQPKPKIGRATFAVGYVATAPWGWAVGMAVVYLVGFVAAMAAGVTIGDALKLPLAAAAMVGLVNAVVRYRHRDSLERVWQRLRSGEFRRDN